METLARKYSNPSLIASIGETANHSNRVTLGQFIEHLCAKYPNGNAIQFVTRQLLKLFKRVCPHKSLEANGFPTAKIIPCVTGKAASTFPRLPTVRNSLEWEKNCVALRRQLLRIGSR